MVKTKLLETHYTGVLIFHLKSEGELRSVAELKGWGRLGHRASRFAFGDA